MNELAQEFVEKHSLVRKLLKTMGHEDAEPGNDAELYLMRLSKEALKALRGKIISRRKVVYLQQYQSAKST